MQGLRAANNAGFDVPKGTVEQAVKYLEKCKTPEGGIEYSLGSGGGARLAISAAAIATLYNAGQYDSKLADDCLHYVETQFNQNKGTFNKEGGHDFYTHLYAAQAFYQAGDTHWDNYFPATRDQLVHMQGPPTGPGPATASGTSTGRPSPASSSSCRTSSCPSTSASAISKPRFRISNGNAHE